MAELGKLVQVDLRKVWEHEARDFSAWLVKPENLSLLSEQLGIEIEPIDTEASIGRRFWNLPSISKFAYIHLSVVNKEGSSCGR